MDAKYARALRLSFEALVEGVAVATGTAGVVVVGVVMTVLVEVVKGAKVLVELRAELDPRLLEVPLVTAVGTVPTAPALPNRPPTALLRLLVWELESCCSFRRRVSAQPRA